MAIEAVIFDVSGTLLVTHGNPPKCTSTPQAGVEQMLDELKAMNLTLIAASNDPVGYALGASGLATRFDHVVEKKNVGIAKGSPRWVDKFVELTDLQPNQMLYIGDTTRDMVTATRGPMIYAHAGWSQPRGPYGLHAPNPQWVVAVLRHIFRKRHPWYWTLDTADRRGRAVRAMTLLNANGAGSERLKHQIVALFKRNTDSRVGRSPMGLREFILLHMLASIYDSNLFGGIDFWTSYPGHDGALNAVMGDFLDVAAKLSRNRYQPRAFDRHRPAMHSLDAWNLGSAPKALENQITTVRLGDSIRGNVSDKRIVLLDNFLTRGYSTEAGRTLLEAMDVAEVVIACVGKYGPTMHVISAPDVPWDPFTTHHPDLTRFSDHIVTGETHREALAEFTQSHSGMSDESW